MDTIRIILDHILEKLQNQIDVQHNRDDYGFTISWYVDNPKLKMRLLPFTILLRDGYAIVDCYDLCVDRFDYTDPAFPDNLLNSLSVLSSLDDVPLP